MTKYNTGNPVGSADPRDLYDTATVADKLVQGTDAAYPDRLGVSRRSWKSVEAQADQQATDFDADQADRAQRFNDFLASSGYDFAGDYAAGIEITEYNQIIRDSAGELWRASGSTTLPYTTTGAGLPEGGAFVAVGDAVLRQELAGTIASGQGALRVSGSVIYADTVADLQALPAGELVNGQQAMVAGSAFKWGDAAGSFISQNGLSVRAFGAVGDGVTDDAPAFLEAFKYAGRDGRKIIIPSGTYFFGSTVALNSLNLGFNWRNLIIEGEASSSPYQGGGGYTNTAIKTNGYSAFEINLEAFGHERILFSKIAFLNESGATRVGARAIDIIVDGSRSFNYPVGWFLDELSCENFESLVRTHHFNITNQNRRFIGRFVINRAHTWNTDYVLDVDGSYLNLFSGYDWRCHSSGKVRIKSNSGGFFHLSNCHWESARPSVFEIDNLALSTRFSLHNYDGETNGDRDLAETAPYPNGFVSMTGVPSSTHEFIFTGFARLPSFGEGPVQFPQVYLSAYTDSPITIIPRGTIIRTPETVRINAPVKIEGSSTSRHFRFMVPLSRAKGFIDRKHVDRFAGGDRGVFSSPVVIKKANDYPGYAAESSSVYRHSQGHDNEQGKQLFAASWVMDVDRNSTRLSNPAVATINGTSENVFLSSEIADEPCVCVFGVLIDPATESLDVLQLTPVNPGSDYIKSPAVGSWYDDRQYASDYLMPDNYRQFRTDSVSAGADKDIGIYCREDNDPPTIGLVGRLTIDVDDGLLGQASYLFRVTADGRTVTEETKYTATGITLTGVTVSSFHVVNVRVGNATAAAVSVRSTVEWL